jgi:hypothetical protein
MVPKDRRGLGGGLIQGAFPIGFTALSLVSTITLSITSHAQYCDGLVGPTLRWRSAPQRRQRWPPTCRARTSGGLFLSLAGQRKAKGT